MSHTTATTPSQALYSFSLTHEQALNIATSLASDIGCAEEIMPPRVKDKLFTNI